MTIRHYSMLDGLSHVDAGQVLHETMMDDWTLAISDGRGVCQVPLRVVRRTGDTCVGDWRLSPLDVGFDVRAQSMAVAWPADQDIESVGIDIDGETYEVWGPPDVLIAVARAAGYTVIGGAV